MAYTVLRTVEQGIERIVYRPKRRRFETPILMQHGMWHGAWCWAPWQALFAEWGWESVAFSLPGHGGSPTQRPLRWCTLGYYLRFLVAEVERLPRSPVLMGHSMGGALVQRYLKEVGDLPAAVLVAPWTSHSMLRPVFRFFRLDPVGFLLCIATLTTTPVVRTPDRAAKIFLHPGALLSPEELHARLGPESLWVLLQHSPGLWRPAREVRTPLLWLAGGDDLLILEPEERRSAAYYGAEYVVIDGAGHDLMLEGSSRRTAEIVRDWLLDQALA